MESPCPDIQWRFRPEHYFLKDHAVDTTFVFNDPLGITRGNDVAWDVNCDIMMGCNVVIGTYHDVTMYTDVTRTLIYYVLLCAIMIFLFYKVKSLKMYIKH